MKHLAINHGKTPMGISDNDRFSVSSALLCKCGCGMAVREELVDFVLLLGRYMGHSVTIVSGARCVDYNKRVGGVPHSQHLKGLAVDVSHRRLSRSETDRLLLNAMRISPHVAVGVYDTFVHFDLRGRFAFWDGRRPMT